jgi:hypothetical protein
MMKTSDIDRILRRNLVTAPFYLGCFAADRIPISPPHYPHCMVVNTDPGWAKGAHWVSIYLPSLQRRPNGTHHLPYAVGQT